MLPGEDAAAFNALEAALMEELAPEGRAAGRARAARRRRRLAARARRADRGRAFCARDAGSFGGRASSLGLALIRDCNGARAFDTLLRYRGGTLAELWRALRTLKALQAERAAQASRACAGARRRPHRAAPRRHARETTGRTREPQESLRFGPGEKSGRTRNCGRAGLPGTPRRAADVHCRRPAPDAPRRSNPRRRRNLGESAPRPAGEIAKNGSASLLAGTALVSASRRQA